MSQGILVFIETSSPAWSIRLRFEAIAAAQSLGAQLSQPVSAVVLGSGIDALAQDIAPPLTLPKFFMSANPKLCPTTLLTPTTSFYGIKSCGAAIRSL